MLRARFGRYIGKIRVEIYNSFTEEYTARQVAASFSLGTFITMLPTLGTGLLLFVVLVYLFDWINKIALCASVLVFNPVVKWGVYAASFALGFALLGPVAGFGVGDAPSLSEGNAIIVRLLVGNMILAIVAAVLAYVVVYRLLAAYEENQFPVVEETVDEFVEELEEQVATDVAQRESGQSSGEAG